MSVYTDNSIGNYIQPSIPSVSRSIAASSASIFSNKSPSGYPANLRIDAALNDNESGRFSLVNGLVSAGTTVAFAKSKIEEIRDILKDVRERIDFLATTSSTTEYLTVEKNRQHELLKDDLKEIGKKIEEAKIGGFNLLDATDSRGVSLNISSGALSNIQLTERLDFVGNNKDTNFDPNKVIFETTDVLDAFKEFDDIELLLFPDPDTFTTENNDDVLNALTRFESTITTAKSRLDTFSKQLSETANEYISLSSDAYGVNNAADAKNLASQLSQQLDSQNLNITANPGLKYFSLFS